MSTNWHIYDLEIKETHKGLIIKQDGDAYVAKNWKETKPVIEIFEIALKHGLVCLIQNGHPQSSKREPKGDGAEYISFSRVKNEYWVMCINDNSPSNKKYRTDVNTVLFNKQYRGILKQADIPYELENFRNASNIEVSVEHTENAIKACLPFMDFHAKRKGRRGKAGDYPGFREEADIERWLMENINDKIMNRDIMVLDRQVRVDVGIIDILLRDKESGGLIILEVKQGRSQPIVVEEQLNRYITSKDIKKMAKGCPIFGCLVAEKIEDNVIRSIKNSPHKIRAYEITWLNKDAVDFQLKADKW